MCQIATFFRCGIFAVVALLAPMLSSASLLAQAPQRLFAKDNLVAWCIVPFDSAKRSPEDRADMLRELGFRRFAYDYRAEHIPTFDREIEALKKNGVELFAWWFPTTLNNEAKLILETIKKHDVHPQLWVMGGGNAVVGSEESDRLFLSETARIRTIATAAKEVGCQVGLYNHGGWFGQPQVMAELVRRVNMPNVGIVFNLHHAHDQLDELPRVLNMMRPYLYAINLNGMESRGDKIGKKIVPLGQGTRDLEVLKAITASGFTGPIGILNHTDEDARARLEMNLMGLEKLVRELE
jgi:hypothetical protein